MGIGGCQGPSAQLLQVRVREYGSHQPFAEALPAKGLQDEHVIDVCERSVIGYHPSEAHLLVRTVHPKGEGMLHRALHLLQRYALRPVGYDRQKPMHRAEVQAPSVRTDNILSALPFMSHRSLLSDTF